MGLFNKKEKTSVETLSNLTELNKTSTNNVKVEDIKGVDSAKDIGKKKKTMSSKLFKYWVIVFKNGKRINSFGVNEEEYAGVKLLVRREEVKGESKIVFRALYPEPKFDPNTVYENRKHIKDELNKLLQIEKELQSNMFLASPKNYNYDISDVRLKIKELEVMLESIRYGKTFRYDFDIRDDGIPVFMYELENSEFKLLKYVKESNRITEASENKKIESEDARRQIDRQLKKRNDRDWQLIARTALALFLLAIATYATFQWLTYNSEQAFQDTKKQLEDVVEKQGRFIDQVITEIQKVHNIDDGFNKQIIQSNAQILDQCMIPNQVPTSG